MKSKSFDLGHLAADTVKPNRVFDFVNLYKTSGGSSASFSGNFQSGDVHDTESHKVKSNTPRSEKTSNKRKKAEKREPINIPQIAIRGPKLNTSYSGSSPINESQITSTPLVNRKPSANTSKVKSIIKNLSAVTDDTMDDSNFDSSSIKSNKRNKSVKFMLDNEEVASKKSKSDDSTDISKNDTDPIGKGFKTKRQFKKSKKDRMAGKENKLILRHQTKETDDSVLHNSVIEKAHDKMFVKSGKAKTVSTTSVDPAEYNGADQAENVDEIKKKHKKPKKIKKTNVNTESIENLTADGTSQEATEKIKKPKKKKHQEKPEAENEEPASKFSKTDMKSDVVKELENLSIGDNTHTLTNLLDEMTVVDKDKRKKLKGKINKNKKPKSIEKTDETEKTDDVQEKVKWMRRKWNKENKGDAKEASLDTTVIIENLPLSLLLSYKKVLAEHFVKYGLIRNIGIAEFYPTEVSKPVFTTTINFYSDEAATQALDDDTVFEGNRISFKRPLPPMETTLVVRSYAPLTTQCIGTLFAGAGRIRSIRNTVKGKHSMATYFVEFDGPKSVKKAMRLATDAKIAGKKVYVSKFEHRAKNTKQVDTHIVEGDADQS